MLRLRGRTTLVATALIVPRRLREAAEIRRGQAFLSGVDADLVEQLPKALRGDLIDSSKAELYRSYLSALAEEEQAAIAVKRVVSVGASWKAASDPVPAPAHPGARGSSLKL